MHATVRRLKTQPGKAEEVGALIAAEYVPLLDGVPGFVSYTLVELADDEISSLGLFESADSAQTANDLARNWVAERLSPFIAEPLQAGDGHVLVNASNTP